MVHLILFLGCVGSETINFDGSRGTCDPLDESLCAFPFPSSFFLKEENNTATGWQIDFRQDSLPESANEVPANPRFWNERDGFSPLSPIMFHFPDVSLEGVVEHTNLDAYLAEDVKTVIVDVETGQRVPHFVELDMMHEQDDRRAIILRPVEPMQWGHRYVVGIRDLTDTSGAQIQPSSAFKALRDDSYTKNYDIEERRSLYEEIVFPALETSGFERSEIQLAWDFVVASREATTGKAIWMRDDMLNRIPEEGPLYSIDDVQIFTTEENPDVAKKIYGTMTVPYYTEEPLSGSLLSRDENNWPIYMGETDIPFTVIVPRSLWEEGRSGPILQYGHGLLGSQQEVHDGYLGTIANRYGYVLLALDWSGMSRKDLDDIMLMIVDEIERFAIVPERTQQGFIEFIAAERMLNGRMSQDDELITINSDGDNISVVDTTQSYFYGNSQGGILGTSYVALSPYIDRAVLGVCGAPFSLLLPRSTDFDTYFLLLKTMYPDYMEISLWLGLMQTLWDSSDPSGYMGAYNDPFSGNNTKHALLQVGIGDAQVSTLGAQFMARGIGAGLVADPTRSVWGLTELEEGHVGSGLVEWDYGHDEPIVGIPADGNAHGRVRQEFLGQEQLDHFLRTGQLSDTCNGPCQSE
jgi:hypothetical protein